MKVGPLVITTVSEEVKKDSARSEELKGLQAYIYDELGKINKQIEGKNTSEVADLNKDLSFFGGIPFMSWLYSDEEKRYKKPLADIRTLQFWATELPNAPASIDYIIRTSFARKWSLKVRNGKEEDEELRARIERFIRRANQNGTCLVDVLKSTVRNALQTGDGYIEKVMTRDDAMLAEVYPVRPENMIVLVDEEEVKKGVIKITGYAKVDTNEKDSDQVDPEKIEDNEKLDKYEVVHAKVADEGDVYGHAPLEENQQITKLIIDILNLNSKRFTNEIVHSLWIKLGKNATQIDANLFLAQYKANYLGKGNWGKPLVTFGGIEVEKWELPFKEFDYQGFMEKFGYPHAPTLFGVSPSELNNTDAKYANSEQGHTTTVLNTIYPWQDKIEDIVNYEIIPALEGLTINELTGDYDGECTYEFILGRENVLSNYKDAEPLSRVMLRGAISPNEFRRIIDPKFLPQIDEDWANEYYVLLGKDLSVISEEFFGGTDDETKDSIDYGDQKIINLKGFLNKPSK